MIQDSITLDVAPELFLKQTLDDISFIDQTFRILLDELKENQYLIEREDLLDQLCNSEEQFSRVLKELYNHEGEFSVRGISGIGEKLAAYRSYSMERQKTARKLSLADESPDSVYVSSDELTQLLKAF